MTLPSAYKQAAPPLAQALTAPAARPHPSWMTHHLRIATTLSKSLHKTTWTQRPTTPPHPMAPRSTTSPCRRRKHHVPPTRTRLTIPPLLTTSIRPRNPPRPRSFPTALMSQPTLTCGTAISQLPHCSARMNSCKATSATWPAHYNAWPASSSSEVWKDATATTSPNWHYSANQPGSSYPRSSNLAGTNSIHPQALLSATTSLPMLEIC